VGIAGIALLITLMLQLKAKREADWRHYAATNHCTVQQLGSTQETTFDVATVINSDGSTGTAMVPGKDAVAVAVWFCENTGETHVRKIR
jgi:VCBS repeat-containing protein